MIFRRGCRDEEDEGVKGGECGVGGVRRSSRACNRAGNHGHACDRVGRSGKKAKETEVKWKSKADAHGDIVAIAQQLPFGMCGTGLDVARLDALISTADLPRSAEATIEVSDD